MRLRTVYVNQRGNPFEAAKTRIVAVWKPINDQPALGNLEIKVRVSIKKSWGVTATNAGRRHSFSFLRARKISRNQPTRDRTQIPLLILTDARDVS